MRFVVVQEPTTWGVIRTAVIRLTGDGADWFAARANQEVSRKGRNPLQKINTDPMPWVADRRDLNPYEGV